MTPAQPGAARVARALFPYLRRLPTQRKSTRDACGPRLRPDRMIRLTFLSLLLVVPGFAGEQLKWEKITPKFRSKYEYVMTARIWLGLFWLTRDDVGGGYIGQGIDANDPHLEVIQLVFGSDPAKAWRGINRWGAATELVRRGGNASAVMGFMKSSRGKTASEMKRELANEKTMGSYQFEGLVSRTDRMHTISATIPISSTQDFNL